MTPAETSLAAGLPPAPPRWRGRSPPASLRVPGRRRLATAGRAARAPRPSRPRPPAAVPRARRLAGAPARGAGAEQRGRPGERGARLPGALTICEKRLSAGKCWISFPGSEKHNNSVMGLPTGTQKPPKKGGGLFYSDPAVSFLVAPVSRNICLVATHQILKLLQCPSVPQWK